MLQPINAADETSAARLLEFLDQNTPWQRSLWGTGIVLSIEELLEASQAVQAGTLSAASLERFSRSCLKLAREDPVVTPVEKGAMSEQLRGDTLLPGSVRYLVLRDLSLALKRDYLRRWSRLLGGGTPPASEVFAKCVASSLLDEQFSETFLHRWCRQKLVIDPAPITLSEFCEQAHLLIVAQTQTTYEALVAFKNAPRLASGYPPTWKSGAQVAAWLSANHFSTAGVRVAGGFVLEISARDALAAGRRAVAYVDTAVARSSIAGSQALEAWPAVWVRGYTKPITVESEKRGVRVKALYRESQIFPEKDATIVDAAIELLSHLQRSSPAAAIAGGWAAIEGLLPEPNNRSGAADNLALLIACSAPHAELTYLSHVLQKKYPTTLPSLSDATLTSRARAAIVAEFLASNRAFKVLKAADNAAIARMHGMFDNAASQLRRLQELAGDAMHRMYRQRNLILHGGVTNSVALDATLRTVSKLAGIGVDRIVHGFYVEGLQPLELVARAKLSAAALSSATSPTACVELLGRA